MKKTGDTKKANFLYGRKIEDIEDFIVEIHNFPATAQSDNRYPFNSIEYEKTNFVNGKEQFTIIIFTHSAQRSQLLFEILTKLSGLVQLNQVIIIWSNRDLPDDSDLKWPQVDYKLRVSL